MEAEGVTIEVDPQGGESSTFDNHPYTRRDTKYPWEVGFNRFLAYVDTTIHPAIGSALASGCAVTLDYSRCSGTYRGFVHSAIPEGSWTLAHCATRVEYGPVGPPLVDSHVRVLRSLTWKQRSAALKSALSAWPAPLAELVCAFI